MEAALWKIANLTRKGSKQFYSTLELGPALSRGLDQTILQEFDAMILRARSQAVLVQGTRRYSSTTSH